MDSSFVKAISVQSSQSRPFSLDSILLFSRAEWISVTEYKPISILLQWITVFIFMLWSIDCLANGQINWAAFQYPVVFALFSVIFFAKDSGREDLIPVSIVSIVLFMDIFFLASAIISGPAIFAVIQRNLVFYTAPVAVANSVVFKPKIALLVNLLIMAFLAVAAAQALVESPAGWFDLHLVARIFGVIGFYLWFAVAQFFAFSLYMRHRLELVEVHHLVAEMERNQRLNEENARIRDDLVRTQRVQMVDSMTSTMAHEVNQPISCANNYIQAARRWLSRPVPEVDEALVSLGGAQDEIIRVSDRVMSVRRLMQRLSSEYTSIDLADLVERVEQIVRRDVAAQNIELSVVLPEDGDDYYIFGCEEELIQVLMNLTSNAADALLKRQRLRQIVISISPADLGEVEVAVSDNGCGVPASDLGKVFDRLYSTKPGGSGLGLSLCQRIVTNHGGTIGMESTLGSGTRVVIRFPRAEVQGSGWGA